MQGGECATVSTGACHLRRARAVRVVPRIAQVIDWRRVNLVNEPEVSALGEFDVVICRNVLIYFRDRTVEKVVNNLTQRLKSQGQLLVGASESLLRFAIPFSCEEHGGVFFYRKQSQ